MCAVRLGSIHVLHQGHPFQHVSIVVAAVGAAMDHGEAETALAAEDQHHRHCEQAVHGAGHVRKGRAAVGGARQFHGKEDEGRHAVGIEAIGQETAHIADLVIRDLEDELHVLPALEQVALPLGQLVIGLVAGEELGHAPGVHGAVALVAERVQDGRGGVSKRLVGEAG